MALGCWPRGTTYRKFVRPRSLREHQQAQSLLYERDFAQHSSPTRPVAADALAGARMTQAAEHSTALIVISSHNRPHALTLTREQKTKSFDSKGPQIRLPLRLPTVTQRANCKT